MVFLCNLCLLFPLMYSLQSLNASCDERIKELEISIGKHTELLLVQSRELALLRRMIIDGQVSYSREQRLLAPVPTYQSTLAIAFYSQLSHDEIKPSAHHTIIFDQIKTNEGNAYNNNSGVFTAPVHGIYGFLYTLKMGCNTAASFEIIKNYEVEGTIHINVNNGCAGQMSTGNAILELAIGDIVYVRTHATIVPSGTLESNRFGSPYFSGWLISTL